MDSYHAKITEDKGDYIIGRCAKCNHIYVGKFSNLESIQLNHGEVCSGGLMFQPVDPDVYNTFALYSQGYAHFLGLEGVPYGRHEVHVF